MTTVLWLLAVQGALGAFDTLYFHEWRARLVARGPSAHVELRLHAWRSFIYAVLFAGFALFAWKGAWTIVLVTLLLAEIVITMSDFVIEDRVRKGQRVRRGRQDRDLHEIAEAVEVGLGLRGALREGRRRRD